MEDYTQYGANLAGIYSAVETITGINKSYYDDVCLVSRMFRAFRDDCLRNSRVVRACLVNEPTVDKDAEQYLTTCIITDALRCINIMGDEITVDGKESFGLYLLMAHLISSDPFSLQYDRLHLNIASLRRFEFAVSLQSFADNFLKEEDLATSTLIQEASDLVKQYHILLYRWCSLVAKADEKVTDTEQKWLSKLLGMKDASLEKKESVIIEEPSLEITEMTTKDSQPSPMEQLQEMIGLDSVKQEINTLYNFVRIQRRREECGLKTTPLSYHCVFVGNAGTGKTTVARIVAQIYKELGILKKGHLVETDRSGLVAEYVGQTAVKTNKIIDSALDGVLFIDEAYSLADGGKEDFGKEAISTLIKRMEDDRGRLVVILAGYGNDMQRFIDSNIGLQSRFNRYVHFKDYSVQELFDIFMTNVAKYDYKMTEEAKDKLMSVIAKAHSEKDNKFGNGRYVRNLFERTIENQSNRLAYIPSVSADSLSTITELDI